MSEILSVERIASILDAYGEAPWVRDLCASHEALRAENAKLRALVDEIRKNLNELAEPFAAKQISKARSMVTLSKIGARTKIGTLVLVLKDNRDLVLTTTRSEAWPAGDKKHWLIKVDGIAGGYDVARVYEMPSPKPAEGVDRNR